MTGHAVGAFPCRFLGKMWDLTLKTLGKLWDLGFEMLGKMWDLGFEMLGKMWECSYICLCINEIGHGIAKT